MSLDLSLNYSDFEIGMDKTGSNAVYEFDRFRIDASKLMLYCGDVEVSMPPKMVKTLLVLVESRGTIISKDELLERVWSDTIVDESNLSQHLYHLRKVLGELADGRPYIETLRRRGYRFNGEVAARSVVQCETPSITPESTRSRHPHAEREGNVLRLVDWAPSPRKEVKEATSSEQAGSQTLPPTKSSLRSALFIAAASFVLLGTAVIIYKFASSAPSRAAASGEISILRLTNGALPEAATISPNGDYFVYHELVEDGERLWLQQIGQANRIKIGEAAKGMMYGPKTFSPDGKTLYLILFEQENGHGGLYRMPAIGGPLVKILDDVEYPVSFSPDGTELVLIRFDRKTETTSLVIADKDGNSQRSVLSKGGQNRLVGSPAWSPDGKSIVFASVDADNTTGLYATDVTGASTRRISNERWDNAYRIVWLPDGQGLLMIATRHGDSYTTRRNQVYYVSYPEGESRRLTTDGSRHQEWSLGVSNDEAVVAVPFNRSSQIWSMTSSGNSSSAIQLSRGIADGRAGLAPLPDGRVGFIARVGEEIGIWLMNADGSGLKQTSCGSLPVVEELRSDPKGRYFVFSGSKDNFSNLYRCDVDTGKFAQLTFGGDQPVDSAVSSDGRWVVYHSAISGGVIRPPKLFRISIDGGDPAKVSETECSTPHYAPEGDLLSCVRGEEFVVLAPSTGALVKSFRLQPYTKESVGSKWTPDGKGLVYIRSEKGVGNLWVQPVDGGAAKQLTDFSFGDIYNFEFSFDRTRLFVARGQQISDVILLRNFR